MIVDERKALVRFARRAKVRLAFARGVEWTLRALFHAALVALAAVLVHKIFAWPLPVVPGLIGLGAAALAIGVAAAFLPGIPLHVAAGVVDERAGWKERLSSALAIRDVANPMEAALVADAVARLRSTSPSELIPLRAPGELKLIPLALLLTAGLAWWMPSFDVLGTSAEAKKKAEDKKKVGEALQKLQDKKKELEKGEAQSEAVKQIVKKIDAMVQEFEKNPPSDPKQALAQLNPLSDELKKMKDEAGKAQAMAERIQQAMQKDQGEAGELGNLLKAGKFEAAAQELAKMRNALQEGKLTPEQKEKLRKQMDKLAEELSKKKGLEELEKKLADAQKGLQQDKEEMLDGLQDELSKLDDGLKDADALSDALKDLEDLADALAQGEKECPSCGKKKSKDGKDGDGCKGDGDCEGGLGLGKGKGKGKGKGEKPTWDGADGEDGEDGEGQGPGGTGKGKGNGPGTGGDGQGEGGEPPERPDDTATQKSKAKSPLGKGKYVGAYSLKGEPPKGEAAAEYADVQQSYEDYALDALRKQKIPASQKEYVRNYFDAIRLEKLGQPKK